MSSKEISEGKGCGTARIPWQDCSRSRTLTCTARVGYADLSFAPKSFFHPQRALESMGLESALPSEPSVQKLVVLVFPL